MDGESFTARRVGTRGCEIVGPAGVIAWTTDEIWAAVITALLSGAPRHFFSRPFSEYPPGDEPGTEIAPDTVSVEESKAARAAIEYLSFHQPVITVGFSADDPPPDSAKRLLAPHMVGLEGDIAELVCRYLMQQAAPHLGLSGFSISPNHE